MDPLQKYTSIEALYALVGGPYGYGDTPNAVESSSRGLNIPFVSDLAILNKFIALCEEGKWETANREKILWLCNRLQRSDIRPASEKILKLKEVIEKIFARWRSFFSFDLIRCQYPQLSCIVSPVAKEFQSLLSNPKITFILFRTEDGLHHLFSKEGVRPSCVNLENPLSFHQLHLTNALRDALEANSLETNVFINRALVREQLYFETRRKPVGSLFCIREADGSFTILNEIPSLEPCYIVDEGAYLFTPVMSNPSLMNLTIKVEASYIKLRNLTVYPRALKIWRELEKFKPERWLSVGTGRFALLVEKQEIWEGIEQAEISREQRQKIISKLFLEASFLRVRAVGSSLATSSAFYEERKETIVRFMDSRHKITSIFTPAGNLAIVALKQPKEGTVKVVKKAFILFGKKERSLENSGQLVVIGKGKKEVNSQGEMSFCRMEILKEAGVSQEFHYFHIPYILSIYSFKRCNEKKAGILMEYCEGDFVDYRSVLYLEQKGHDVLALSPESKKLFIQVINALLSMHERGWIHGDVKLTNVLYKKTETGQLEARLCDFGGTSRIPAFVHDIVATYPPPEFLQELEAQKKKNIPIPHVPRTPEGDAWAFGVMLFSFIYGKDEAVTKLSFSNKLDVIVETAEKICCNLSDKDPASLLIKGLLEVNPQDRMPLKEAKRFLL